MTNPLTAALGIIARIMCAIFDHKYFTSRVFSPISRQVVCSRCGRRWGMHDETRSFIEWDGELEQLYRTLGQWPGISPEEEQRNVCR